MKFQKKGERGGRKYHSSLWTLFNFIKFIKCAQIVIYYLEFIPNFLLKFQYKRMQFPLPRIYIVPIVSHKLQTINTAKISLSKLFHISRAVITFNPS